MNAEKWPFKRQYEVMSRLAEQKSIENAKRYVRESNERTCDSNYEENVKGH